jgi:alpha-tubulin suppressor-like RCC1 family protein
VELRQPADAAATGDAAQAALVREDLERTAQDLLFGLPAGSYDAVQLEADSPSLTLRVDAAGLDELLVSPLLTAVAAAVNPAMQGIAAGYQHSLAVKPDASLWAWGANASGQLGDGTTIDRISPVPIMAGVAAVASGAFHTLALKTDGSVWAWGQNWVGQLGDGTSLGRTSPVYVLSGVSDIAAAGDAIYGHSLAVCRT